jgi:hypothetical protein
MVWGDFSDRKTETAPLGPLRYLRTILSGFGIFHTVELAIVGRVALALRSFHCSPQRATAHSFTSADLSGYWLISPLVLQLQGSRRP